MEKFIAAIELGSKNAKLVVGYELDGKPYVIYTLVKPYEDKAIECGNFKDFNKVINAVKDLCSIVDPSVRLRLNIQEVVLCLPPYGLEVLSTKQTTGTTNSDQRITKNDIKNLYSIIRNCKPNQSENVLVDIIPQSFLLDNYKIFLFPPLGEVSGTIQMTANVHALPRHVTEDYKTVITKAGAEVKRSVVSSSAALELIGINNSMPASYFLVDIGSSVTTISLIGKKVLYSSQYFGWGGDDITDVIQQKFEIEQSEAEKYKVSYGIDERVFNFDPPICSLTKEDGTVINHTRRELNEIIKLQLDEFVRQLNYAIDTLVNSINPAYRALPIVLTGGGSKLYGLIPYIKNKLPSEKIYLYQPDVLGARDPTFTNCLGAILVCGKYKITFDENSKIGPIKRDN